MSNVTYQGCHKPQASWILLKTPGAQLGIVSTLKKNLSPTQAVGIFLQNSGYLRYFS